MLTCIKWPSYFLAEKVAATLIEVSYFFSSPLIFLINTAPRFEFDDSPIHAHLGPCKCSLYKQGHLTQKRQKSLLTATTNVQVCHCFVTS